MKKKVLAVLSVSLATTFLLGACGGSAKPQTEAPASQGTAAGGSTEAEAPSGDKIVMKISHVSSPGSARDLGCQKLAEVVEEMTGGRVEAPGGGRTVRHN